MNFDIKTLLSNVVTVDQLKTSTDDIVNEVFQNNTFKFIENKAVIISLDEFTRLYNEKNTKTNFDNNCTQFPSHETELNLKIGKLVRGFFLYMQEKNELDNSTTDFLEKKENCKQVFGISYGVLKYIPPNSDISEYIKDNYQRNRYWNEIFTFNNKHYVVCSQWGESHKPKFLNWIYEHFKIEEIDIYNFLQQNTK